MRLRKRREMPAKGVLNYQQNILIKTRQVMEIEKSNFETQEQQMVMPRRKYCELSSSFTLNEVISSSESSRLEFKNYQWPFKNCKDLENSLLKTICSFLNRQGGTILIGVNDSKVVVGVQLEGQQIDEAKRHFDSLKKRFYPLPEGLIETVEIPVKELLGNEKYKWKSNMYVLRIQILQGQTDRYYTFMNDKQICSAFREDAGSQLISEPEKIMENIYQRCRYPIKQAEYIKYEYPDQEGLAECSLTKSFVNQEVGVNYIGFANVFRTSQPQFIEFISQKLKERNIAFQFIDSCEYLLLLTGPSIQNIWSAIIEINNENKETIKKLTFCSKDLIFGFPKKAITIKNAKTEELDTIKKVSEAINCNAAVNPTKDNKQDVLLTEIDSFENFIQAYTHLKDSKLQAYIFLHNYK